MGVMMTGMFATLFYIPLFLQVGQGYQALDTGLLLLPQALVMAVLMPISGRLYDRSARGGWSCPDCWWPRSAATASPASIPT